MAAALAFLVMGACLGSPLTPLIEWVGRATAHFAIFTKAADPGEEELLGRLETARLFFKGIGWASRDLKRPLTIVAFPSPKDFENFRFNPAAFAFYQRTWSGDFVLMRALEPEHYSVAVHEYTHFVVEHSGMRFPLWLNEGLADFYSTVQYRNAQALVGLPPPGREDSLRRNGWMDWNALASVDQRSPYYRQQDMMLSFYAQSWALVHLLAVDPVYAGKFQSFLLAITATPDTAEALAATYHKTLPEIGHEVEDAVRGKRLQPQTMEMDIRPGALETAPVADSSKLAEFALADVQATDPRLSTEARARLAMLAAKYPDDPHAEESLGFMAIRAGAGAEAEQHFARAVKAHSKDPDVLFRYAHLRIARGDASDEVVDLLKQAVAADPNNYNALLELGFAAVRTEDFDLALQTLSKIRDPKPEHAYVLAYNLAYCFSELHQSSKARPYAEQAIKIATNARDKEEAQGLLHFITQESRREVATYE
jgi:Flp pilus assembly protein TadD